jgi:hypothetical protein
MKRYLRLPQVLERIPAPVSNTTKIQEAQNPLEIRGFSLFIVQRGAIRFIRIRGFWGPFHGKRPPPGIALFHNLYRAF